MLETSLQKKKKKRRQFLHVLHTFAITVPIKVIKIFIGCTVLQKNSVFNDYFEIYENAVLSRQLAKGNISK